MAQDLEDLSYRDLQAMAKEMDLPATGKTEELIERIREAHPASDTPVEESPGSDEDVSAESGIIYIYNSGLFSEAVYEDGTIVGRSQRRPYDKSGSFVSEVDGVSRLSRDCEIEFVEDPGEHEGLCAALDAHAERVNG